MSENQESLANLGHENRLFPPSAEFVAQALSPAKVSKVEIVDLMTRSAKVTVPDYQLSLAIGKDGQNARLAARLTGWRIDIHPDNPVIPT